MNQPDYIIEDSTLLLAERLATDVANLLRSAIADRGRATLVVSGGSTPVPFFESLSKQALDWSRVQVTLADERWVASGHPDSNERLVRRHLLDNLAAEASFISLHEPELTAAEAAPVVEQRLRDNALPFDVVVLGMGDDGHTASLFPGAENLNDTLDLHRTPLCAAAIPPEAKHKRMTLTLRALVDTGHLLVHITGQKKRSVLEYALIDGSVNKAPITAVFMQDKVPATVYWAA
ncbi:MAG: 6-phosphogluconolactonase [Granulosicoccus sp.]|nr:6-phosphogluconolactonase [Granulosicoccus sp.]